VEDIDFWVDFVTINSKNLENLGFERKNQLNIQCVHVVKFKTIQCEKSKNMFTLGPTT
jgi:hypothetical protein